MKSILASFVVGVGVGMFVLQAPPTLCPPLLTVDSSIYLGGSSGDSARDVATDADGNRYVTGGTASANFPVVASTTTFGGVHDVYVTKYNPQGGIAWSVLLGGPNYDRAYAIEVSQGFVYVAGRAGVGFPTTAGVIQPVFGGDATPAPAYGPQDGFIAKLDAEDGALVFSTFLGGNDPGIVRDIAITAIGEIWFSSCATAGVPWPHLANAFQPVNGGLVDAIVGRLSANGQTMRVASHLGGSGNEPCPASIATDADGNGYHLTQTFSTNAPTTPGAFQSAFGGGVADWLLTKVNADGTKGYGTFVGGTDSEMAETHNLAVTPSGEAIIAAGTKSPNLPTSLTAVQRVYGGTGGAGTGAATNYQGDGYLFRLSVDGASMVAGTYLGGSFGDALEGVALDAAGQVWVSGASYSNNFPGIASPSNGAADLIAALLSPDFSSLLFASRMGGSAVDVGRGGAVDATGYLAVGESASPNWPTTPPGALSGPSDGVLVRWRK